jgi:hypothetical protein
MDEMDDLRSLLDVKETHIKELSDQIAQLVATNRSLKEQVSFIAYGMVKLNKSSVHRTFRRDVVTVLLL